MEKPPMRVPGMMALAVVAGGIALGAMLGAAANPEMKMAPAAPWQDAIQVRPDGPAYQFVEAGPEDLSPYRDSYAPTWADEEVVDWEPAYPAWTYTDYTVETPRWPADEQPAPVEDAEPAASESPPQPVEPEALPPEPSVAGNLAALY